MRFSASALVVAMAVMAPVVSMAFAPSATFVVKSTVTSAAKAVAVHGRGCMCPTCIIGAHSKSCPCASCTGTALFMSEEAVAEEVPAEVEVPAAVEAVDGVATEEEAHNSERPARASGIQKHKAKGGRPGTPLAELVVGATVEGKVKTITSYGAFLDIGAQSDALLHVSRLSDDFVSNVEDIIKAGETVSVRIVTVDQDKQQVAVTMRSEEAEARAGAPAAGGDGKRRARPQRSGGDREAQRTTLVNLAASSYDSNKMVEGEVVSTPDFGAFVRFDTSQLAEGLTGELDGLCHISSLTVARADSVTGVVKVGDKVQIRIKGLDAEGGKVSLSMIAEGDEQQRGGREGGGGGGGRGRQRDMFQGYVKGPADWADQLASFQETQPKFKNGPVVIQK
eukprot:CAMPEP_0198281076 /NCGR_PEP_ID=MMETSP1449-20131203/1084_1 /TAXON_ID=420275 /ORGANISM="Attheya septentrionalis, Strain CCMP2084" /LENGTH=393 /DNA_ID=CAMNT_0043976707 /DNA_START=43 /DNA_END=1224 /DNA_ORIENTATION=-